MYNCGVYHVVTVVYNCGVSHVIVVYNCGVSVEVQWCITVECLMLCDSCV